MIVTLPKAKKYLRIDGDEEDDIVRKLLRSAEQICMDVARLSPDEWTEIGSYNENCRKTITVHGEEKSKGEILQMKELLRVGVLYSLGYLYEHREEADHHDLVLTLRNLLFAVREGVF